MANSVDQVCKNYFSGFYELGNDKLSAKGKFIAFCKVASYFLTLGLLPLGFAVAMAIGKKVQKKSDPLDPLDKNTQDFVKNKIFPVDGSTKTNTQAVVEDEKAVAVKIIDLSGNDKNQAGNALPEDNSRINSSKEQQEHMPPATLSDEGTTRTSLVNRIRDLTISPDRVTVGQGEYVVFHKLPNGETKALTKETFAEVYNALIQHAPLTLANNGSQQVKEQCGSRYELVKAQLQETDPTLQAVFIPRTLYELIFIRKCIEEDLKNGEICSELKRRYLKEPEEEKIPRKCWHLCCFKDAGDSEDAGVKNIAYRLNKAIMKAFAPSSDDGLTYEELRGLAEKEIQFLQNHHNTKCKIIRCHFPGPTGNFGCESTRGMLKPMGIRDENDAQIIRNAIALECSKVAQHSLLIYRGAKFRRDSITTSGSKPHSLSYGSGLFAGCIYDGDATGFRYMRDEDNNAYAIPIPFDQLKSSPFFVPATHTIAQLFGNGETFHARTKVWQGYDVTQETSGIEDGKISSDSSERDHLKSHLNMEELIAQFRQYKKSAFMLK